jgi:hypothetical protein
MLDQKQAIAQLLQNAGYRTPRLSGRYFHADDLIFVFDDDDRLTKVSVRLGSRGRRKNPEPRRSGTE